MKITIQTIPHNLQRYPTVGDWLFNENGDLDIWVSETGNDDYTFLVGLHEAIEAYLCEKRGIKEEDISKFDIEFEKQRETGNTDEPGDNQYAPYKKEHFFATSIERLISTELGVDWTTYDNDLNNL
jgi:hypothetical protein